MQKAVFILIVVPVLSFMFYFKTGTGKEYQLPVHDNSARGSHTANMAPQLLGAWRDRWAVSSSSLIYTDLYNAEKDLWYGGSKSPWDMNPDPANGVYFDEKGNFVWVVLSSTRPYSGSGCWVHAVEFISGKAEVKGNKITFTPSVRRQRYNSVCNPNQDYDRNMEKNSFEVSFEVNTLTEPDGTQLKVIRLINPDNSFIEYYSY